MSFRPKILLALLSHEEDYQRAQAEAAQAAATREGVELELAFAEHNPVLQIQQIFRALSRPPESRPAVVIVYSVATVGVEGAARAAVQAGIGWVLLNEKTAYLEGLRRDFPGPLVGCVYAENEEVGRLQGRIAKALLPGGGPIVCVEGPSMSPASRKRRVAIEAELHGSQVRIARWLAGDWTALGAERAVRAWLRNAPEDARPGAIVCQNDEMASGVVNALQRSRPGWKDVPVTGCDGVPDRGQQLVREGVLAATVVIPPRAGLAVEAAAKHLRRHPVPFATLVTPHVMPTTRELAVLGSRLADRRAAAVAPAPARPPVTTT